MAFDTRKIVSIRTKSEQAFPYYLYCPNGQKTPDRVFVSIHGITRNALEHAIRLAELCETHNMLLIAPYFSRKRFRYFQTLKPDTQGHRPCEALNEIISDVSSRMSMEINKFVLFGYSGGGQFAHRYALCHPAMVEKLIINAPGWYTMPCAETVYPEGLLLDEPNTDLKIQLKNFCEIPISVLIGSKDTKRESSLNKSPSLDNIQGRNRLARGKTWVQAVNAVKQKLGHQANVKLKIIENSGHDFSKNINKRFYYSTLSDEIGA